MWNNTISLPIKKVTEQDSAGFIDESWEFMGGIPANFMDSTRQDELLANRSGYTADVIVEIQACNYQGASFFVDDSTGDVYDIKRTFRPDRSMMIQLTGERREHGKI